MSLHLFPGTPPRRRARVVIGLLSQLTLLFLAVSLYPFRESLYDNIVRWATGSPASPVIGLVAEFGILVPVLTAVAIGLWAVWSDHWALHRLVVGGVGVVAAYICSESIKLVVSEPRPCSVATVSSILECPGAGDWSWPSNHAVLAAAFTTACVLAVPRLIPALAPVALVIAAARVAAGVHYAHDVAAGLFLGTAVVLGLARPLHPVVVRCVRSAQTVIRRHRPDRAVDGHHHAEALR